MSTKSKTIIRLKRKREEDPLDAFLITEDPKRRLTESAVFSLSESVSINQNIMPRPSVKANLTTALDKPKVLNSRKVAEAKESRFKIVESNRNFSNY